MKSIKIYKLSILLFFLVVLKQSAFCQLIKITGALSPNKTTNLEIETDDRGQLLYRVLFEKKPVIDWSALGLVVNNVPLGKSTVINTVARKQYRESFPWPLGESDIITNESNEIKLACNSSSVPFNVIARVFDGSVAIRYEIPMIGVEKSHVISKENTTFNFSSPFTLYQYNQESIFTPTSIDTFRKTSDLPTTVVTNDPFYISIGEAENLAYTKAELKKGENQNSLYVAFVRDSAVRLNAAMPWRTISISKTAIGLHQFSHLYLKLATPFKQKVPDWIKPGKVIRAQLTTQSGLECIDFAAKHNFQYIMYDAGWYGAEFRDTSNPTKVIPAIDMPKVIAYGKEKGIGVILYVNYVGLRNYLDTILPLYKNWGVSGLKFGFVDGLTQKGLTWLSGAIKKANEYGFLINIHDNYKPTGLSRAFPALLTQEGIRGDENSPDAFHTTVLPFTRFLAGPADFTFCYPNPKNNFSKNLKVSKAQQLALTVVYFSPLQAIFWYGKPLDYTNEGEIEFFKYVPTVWNESRYLDGEIGENISVARRNGNTWFVGNAAGFTDWKGTIKFDFLSKGKTYSATIWEDKEGGKLSKKVVSIKRGDVLPFKIISKGGQAMMIVPTKK